MICPACRTQYSDDTLRFCLQDGTPLTDAQADSLTEAYPNTEMVTSVLSGGQQSDPRFMESQVTRVGSLGAQVGTPQYEPRKNYTALAVGLTAGAMLLAFAIVGIAGLIIYKNSGGVASNEPSKNTNVSNSFTTISPTPTPSPASTKVPSSPTPMPTVAPTIAPTPPPVRASYPSTLRLKFARGAYTTSFSGEINPGDNRSLVLACRAGQSLSASISNGGSCVSVRGGGSSMRTTTSRGDNYVTVSNSCSTVVRFSISITVM